MMHIVLLTKEIVLLYSQLNVTTDSALSDV